MIFDDGNEMVFFEIGHGILKGALSGEDHEVCFLDGVRVVGDEDCVAEGLNGFLNTSDISCSVIDEGDFHGGIVALFR